MTNVHLTYAQHVSLVMQWYININTHEIVIFKILKHKYKNYYELDMLLKHQSNGLGHILLLKSKN